MSLPGDVYLDKPQLVVKVEEEESPSSEVVMTGHIFGGASWSITKA